MITLVRASTNMLLHYFTGSLDIEKFKKDYNTALLFRTIFLVAKWVVMDEHAQVHGIKVLIDWTGITRQHATTIFSPDNAKKLVNFLQVHPQIIYIFVFCFCMLFCRQLVLFREFLSGLPSGFFMIFFKKAHFPHFPIFFFKNYQLHILKSLYVFYFM